MKAVCVLAGVPVMQEMADTMVAAAKLMGADEVVSGDWLAEDENLPRPSRTTSMSWETRRGA